MIGCEDRLRNDLYCVGLGIKLYSFTHSRSRADVILLQNSIERLTFQVDKMESELESLSSRKKKLDRDVSSMN